MLGFLILMLSGSLFVLHTNSLLPPLMVSHFTASGAPNGFMTRTTYTATMLGLMIGIPCFMAFLPLSFPRLPTSLINIPNRTYWLAPERAQQTIYKLHQWMMVFSCLTLMFLGYVHWLVVQSNQRVPPAMGNYEIYGGLFVFLALTAIWSVGLHRQFRLTQDMKDTSP